jgi:predicted O-methyltransferase YrrM
MLLTESYKQELIQGELGINTIKFLEIKDSLGNNNIFVDLGVETGKSSRILLDKSIDRNNKIYGVDPHMYKGHIADCLEHQQYNFIKEDSVIAGKTWNYGKPALVFIDTVHAKEQVLCELYYWWDLLQDGGYLIFHDTNWENYIHKPNHPCAGKRPGNTGLGYDFYSGIAWETPDKAIKQFFNISELDYEDDFIKVEHGPNDLGMVFLFKKQQKDYKSAINNWDSIEEKRQILLINFK